MLTSTYNCPACKQGELMMTKINYVVPELGEDYIKPIKANVICICKCTNCKAIYKLEGEVTLT